MADKCRECGGELGALDGGVVHALSGVCYRQTRADLAAASAKLQASEAECERLRAELLEATAQRDGMAALVRQNTGTWNQIVGDRERLTKERDTQRARAEAAEARVVKLEEAARNGPVDWSAMSTANVMASMLSAPRVMGPWEDCNTVGGGVRLYAQGMWSRSQEWPKSLARHACVQPSTPGPGWHWSIGFNEGGEAPTANAAKDAADEALRALGYRLLAAPATTKETDDGE